MLEATPEAVGVSPPGPPWHRALIALGSNIDAERHLPAAVERLRAFGTVAAVSTVYQTRPVGFADQPDYLNAAVLLETPLPLAALFDEVVPAVEAALGRVRDPRHPNGPRTIDLDVAYFDADAVTLGRRTIPDPDAVRYPFMAVPLAELDPGFVHPTDGRTLAAIAAGLPVTPGDLRPRPDVQLG